MMAAYHKRLNSSDEEERLVAARAWSKWEVRTILHSLFCILKTADD